MAGAPVERANRSAPSVPLNPCAARKTKWCKAAPDGKDGNLIAALKSLRTDRQKRQAIAIRLWELDINL